MKKKGVMLHDPISDLFTRIRNGQHAKLAKIRHPYSRFAAAIIDAIIRQGYLVDKRIIHPQSPKHPQFDHLEIDLKYDSEGTPAIQKIRRVSKPSNRTYRGIDELPLASAGLGTWILSTPKGVLHCAEARQLRVGGEIIGEIL